MDFSSFFSSFLSAQINKASTYLAKQAVGVKKGNALVNSLAGQLVISAATNSAQIALQKQLSNDKIAKTLGILTTEEGLANVVVQAVQSHPTLDVSQTEALSAFLQSKL